MKKQISHISLHQTAKVIATMLFIISAIVLIPMGIYTLFTPDRTGAVFFLLFPFIYFILSYITWFLWGWLYNIVASHFGGIEFDLTDEKDE